MIKTKLPPVQKIDFGHICESIRKEIRYTQEEMASLFGVAKLTYFNWEKGKTLPDANSAVWLYNTYQQLQKELSEVKSSNE